MKLWAHHPGGTIDQALIELPDDCVPGRDVFTANFAADMTDVSAITPIPAEGWTTADGGKTFSAPAAVEPTIGVPISVSSAQAKIQCLRTPGAESGKTLLDDITAAVQAAGGEAQIWFTEARTWERNNPYVESLSEQLKLTPDQVNTLFVEAAQIAA